MCNSESLNNAHCTSSLGSLKDRWGYCYDSSTYFPHSFSLYTLYMLLPPAYYFLFTFLFPSTDFHSFHVLPYCFYIASCTVCLLMQSCIVCLLMHSLLRCSLITQYIMTGQTVVFGSQSLIDNSSSTLDFLKPLKTILVG